MKLIKFLSIFLFLLFTTQNSFGSSKTAAAFEDKVSLEAADFFKGEQLKGEHYEVEQEVTTDGFLSVTKIATDFGEMYAVGPGMLGIRLGEIAALGVLQDFESSEEFSKGAQQSADEKLSALKQIVDKPKETVQGIGAGVSRFFKRTVRSGKTGLQKVEDVLNDRVPGSDEEGAGSSRLPGLTTSPREANSDSKYEKVAQASGNLAINILGFLDSRRKLAKRLGVDPYTTNRILDEKLDEVTWSIFAGDLGVDIVTSFIPGGNLVSSSTMVTKWVWDIPPGDLRVKIEKTLLAMNISQESVDRLLRHHYYTLTMQAAIANSLEQLKGVEGKEEIMPIILNVASVDQARFVTGTLMMIMNYHKGVKPVSSLEQLGTITIRNADGERVVVAPADHLSWSSGMDKYTSRPEFSEGSKTLFIAGGFSALAEKMLQERGWQLHENSPLFSFARQ